MGGSASGQVGRWGEGGGVGSGENDWTAEWKDGDDEVARWCDGGSGRGSIGIVQERTRM